MKRFCFSRLAMSCIAAVLFTGVSRADTTVGTFSGGDAGEGLDLDGIFRYAIQSGGAGQGLSAVPVRGATFRVDYDANGEGPLIPGISVFGQLTRPWGTIPAYGALPDDDNLEKVMSGIVWMSNPATKRCDYTLEVEPGHSYQLQIILSENFHNGVQSQRESDYLAYSGNFTSDPVAEGRTILGWATNVNVSKLVLPGQNQFRGAVVTMTFTAPGPLITVWGKVSSNPGSGLDQNAIINALTLEALPETQPPRVVSAGSADGSNIGVLFDEPVDPVSAAVSSNYVLDGGTVKSATLRPDGKSVALAVNGLAGPAFRLTVRNVKDLFGNAIAANSAVDGTVRPLLTSNVGNPAVKGALFSGAADSFEVSGGGTNVQGKADQFFYVYEERNGDFDLMARVERLDARNAGSRAGLMLRAAIDAESRHLFVGAGAAAQTGVGLFSQSRITNGEPATELGAAAGTFNFPNTWVRLRRIGGQGFAFVSSSGQPGSWTPAGSADLGLSGPALVGLAVTDSKASGPGTLARARFSGFKDVTYADPRITIIEQPAAQNTVIGRRAYFSVRAKGFSGSTELPEGEMVFQWQKNGVDIPGANAPECSSPPVKSSDEGARFRCVIRLSGVSVTSEEGVLHLVSDTSGPQPVYISNLLPGNTVQVFFNEALNPASAAQLANYFLVDGGSVISAVLQPDGKSVVLTLSGISGSRFTLGMKDIRDTAGNPVEPGLQFVRKIRPFTNRSEDVKRSDSIVVFNEVMYHPPGGESLEWIELYNENSVDVDLSGWVLYGDVEYEFPAGTIIGGRQYLVVAANVGAIRSSSASPVVGPFQGKLSNSGARLLLGNNAGRLMDELNYDNQGDWPAAPDGSGASLSRKGIHLAGGSPESWAASVQVGGTPGRANFGLTDPLNPPLDRIVPLGNPARVLVPSDDSLGLTWTRADFDDSSWQAGISAVGFEVGPPDPSRPRFNVALNRPVIAGSGAYPTKPFDQFDGTNNYSAPNVTDGSTQDIPGSSYWLGRQGTDNEYFILDLQQVAHIEKLRLRNTHNGPYNDRGTRSFEVWAASEVDDKKQLVEPWRILAGSLSDVANQNPITADEFSPATGLVESDARYLKFIALTANNAGKNVGLNELEVVAAGSSRPFKYFPFDGDTRDLTGNGADASNRGAAFISDHPSALRSGSALDFDGTASWMEIIDSFQPTAYTLSCWVKFDTIRACNLIVRTSSAGATSSFSHQLFLDGSGHFVHYTFDGASRTQTGTTVAQAGRWYHVAATARNNGPMTLYVDGVSEGAPIYIGSLWTGGDRWHVAINSGNAANRLDGQMDDLSIWNSCLSREQVSQLAAGGWPLGWNSFGDLISGDISSSMKDVNSTVYIRIPFFVQFPELYDQLLLNIRYDDGFIAYLNGSEVARRNAPDNAGWNAAAAADRPYSDALQAERIDLTEKMAGIRNGWNVLAIHGLNHQAKDGSFLIAPELIARQRSNVGTPIRLSISEISSATNRPFWAEIHNDGDSPVDVTGFRLRTSGGAEQILPPRVLSPGGFLVLDKSGFTPEPGENLFLLNASGATVAAGERITAWLRGRGENPESPMMHPDMPTPGNANHFALHDEIVINEIMYHAAPGVTETNVTSNAEEWIELFNKSDHAVALTGWRLEEAVRFDFAAGTVIPSQGYLVVARDAAALRKNYPGIEIVGNYAGRLSHDGDRIVLSDASDNPVNQVHYRAGKPWPDAPDGGGSSLELRDPRADNSIPQAWDASDERGAGAWKHYSYTATAVDPVYAPATYSYHEFRMSLLAEGEILIDNISVVEDPDGAARELIQNGAFEIPVLGGDRWRCVGTYSDSKVEVDPSNANNHVLHVVGLSEGSYLDNHIETTLKSGGMIVPVVAGKKYRVSFDARWVSGSPQLHTELYYNKVARTVVLDRSALHGTPGRPNSRVQSNIGPTLTGLSHAPVMPQPSNAITVSVLAGDPDGISGLKLFYAVETANFQNATLAGAGLVGPPWENVPMTRGSGNLFSAVIPGQDAGSVIQFYVEATDSRNVTAMIPPAGPASRALIKVNDGRASPSLQNFRMILTAIDSAALHQATNMMSDKLLGTTVVYNEEEVFYDAGIRLHGSMFTRNNPAVTAFSIRFPSDHLFRGIHPGVTLKRGQLKEILVKHMINHAGGIPGMYDDIINMISHVPANYGPTKLMMARYDNIFLDSQYEEGSDGTVYKMEGIRVVQPANNPDPNPEGPKSYFPVGWVPQYDIQDLGEREQYRWSILIENNHTQDRYDPFVAMAKVFSLSGTNLQEAAPEVMDVDEWMRVFAMMSLAGINDAYSQGNPHNISFYSRPGDGKIMAMPWDWDFTFDRPDNSPLWGDKNISKLIALPPYRRMFLSHLKDIIGSTYNVAYMSRWLTHYAGVTAQNFAPYEAYIRNRVKLILNQLPASLPFRITTNDGNDLSINAREITLEGTGGLEVAEIRSLATDRPLAVTWTDLQTWQVKIPLSFGRNPIGLGAYDRNGNLLGWGALTVTSLFSDRPLQNFLRLTELNYNPAPPSAAESSAGFVNADEFEFLELLNTGTGDLNLAGCRFVEGVQFVFPGGGASVLPPGRRLLLVANAAAFRKRYGEIAAVAGEYSGRLSNTGETLTLEDSTGALIFSFTYSDAAGWPSDADGRGRTLEAKNLFGSYDNPLNWRASEAAGGTPGLSSAKHPVRVELAGPGPQRVLRFEGEMETRYRVQSRAWLDAGAWEEFSTVPAEYRDRTVEVPLDASSGQRFFRVLAE